MLAGLDGHICGLVVTGLWSEEIISISLVTARNNTAYSLQSDSALGQEGLWSHYIMDFILVV